MYGASESPLSRHTVTCCPLRRCPADVVLDDPVVEMAMDISHHVIVTHAFAPNMKTPVVVSAWGEHVRLLSSCLSRIYHFSDPMGNHILKLLKASSIKDII